MSDERAIETCREWVEAKADRCNEAAEFILWGKFFDPEALGPRCWDHASERLGFVAMSRLNQYAVFDLRKVRGSSER